MKYIRTEKGIYDKEKIDLVVDIENGEIFVERIIDGYTSHLEFAIKQADTIEELCDTFVIIGKDKDENNNPVLWNIKQDIPFLMKYYFNYNVIYGAIWTSKGLIYVAKMDDEGNLKLL